MVKLNRKASLLFCFIEKYDSDKVSFTAYI